MLRTQNKQTNKHACWQTRAQPLSYSSNFLYSCMFTLSGFHLVSFLLSDLELWQKFLANGLGLVIRHSSFRAAKNLTNVHFLWNNNGKTGFSWTNRAVFGWLSKTKVITQANHRDWEKTVQPIGSQSNSRLVLRLVLLSNQQCEYTPSLAWEVFWFWFWFCSWLAEHADKLVWTNPKANAKPKQSHNITFDSHPKTALNKQTNTVGEDIVLYCIKFTLSLAIWRDPFFVTSDTVNDALNCTFTIALTSSPECLKVPLTTNEPHPWFVFVFVFFQTLTAEDRKNTS